MITAKKGKILRQQTISWQKVGKYTAETSQNTAVSNTMLTPSSSNTLSKDRITTSPKGRHYRAYGHFTQAGLSCGTEEQKCALREANLAEKSCNITENNENVEAEAKLTPECESTPPKQAGGECELENRKCKTHGVDLKVVFVRRLNIELEERGTEIARYVIETKTTCTALKDPDKPEVAKTDSGGNAITFTNLKNVKAGRTGDYKSLKSDYRK